MGLRKRKASDTHSQPGGATCSLSCACVVDSVVANAQCTVKVSGFEQSCLTWEINVLNVNFL